MSVGQNKKISFKKDDNMQQQTWAAVCLHFPFRNFLLSSFHYSQAPNEP